MTAIGTTSAVSAINNNSSKAVSAAVNKALGKDDFLKLLVTELKNQNPLEPTDNKDFIAEMAQFSSLEQMNNVASAMNELNTNLTFLTHQSLLTQGASLIGKMVVGQDENGDNIQGLVNSVKMSNGNILLQVGKKNLDLIDVTDISGVSETTAEQKTEGNVLVSE
ncbi:MAG TPA: flagellar hook capping FlgD N-terminal domain-containing protein [Desulfitobacteriaceae bacterium]|nr:flagellar hook capping FlgD N-terminal domain-containing protein [Desulfitobacteriaceae bacterium]